MKFFSLIAKDEVHIAPGVKVIPADAFSKLVSAEAILKQLKEEEFAYRNQVAIECETYKESAELAGFDRGLQTWNQQLALLDQEIKTVRQELENSMASLLLTAVKRVIGRELQIAPETIVDIISTALKGVTQNKKVKIFVRPADQKLVEKERPRLRALFEHLDSLAIIPREDISEGGCMIETESGIINAQLESQLGALEAAFDTFFQSQQHKKGA